MFRRIVRLSARDSLLVVEALALFWSARLAILLVPLRVVAPLLGRAQTESPRDLPERDAALARRIGWAVSGVSRRSAVRGTCLAQGVATQIMVRRRGISSTLYIGVARDERQQLISHAWVRCGSAILTGTTQPDRFKVVSSFA